MQKQNESSYGKFIYFIKFDQIIEMIMSRQVMKNIPNILILNNTLILSNIKYTYIHLVNLLFVANKKWQKYCTNKPECQLRM